jgi:hypothetical protein
MAKDFTKFHRCIFFFSSMLGRNATSPQPGRRRKDSNEGKESCLVSIRVRPCELNAWNFNGNSLSLQPSNLTPSPTKYAFDNIILGNNQELYSVTARNIVWSAMQGINGTILAYGQTASGIANPLT